MKLKVFYIVVEVNILMKNISNKMIKIFDFLKLNNDKCIYLFII